MILVRCWGQRIEANIERTATKKPFYIESQRCTEIGQAGKQGKDEEKMRSMSLGVQRKYVYKLVLEKST